MDYDPDPDTAYGDVKDFGEVHKQTRDLLRGSQTMLTYPNDPARFRLSHPTAYPEDSPPIPCPISVDTILARARKEVTPLRSSNSRVRMGRKQPRGPTSNADQLLNGLLSFMQGRDMPRHQALMDDIPITFNPNFSRGRPPMVDPQSGAIVPAAPKVCVS